MFDWLQFAIMLLKVVNGIINWAHDRGLIDEGRAQVIAEMAANIANKTAIKKQIQEKVDAMPDDEVDAALGDLVRPPAGSTKKLHS